MKTASYKTLKSSVKIRKKYAYRAIERATLSDDSKISEDADLAMDRFFNNKMEYWEMLDWAVRKQEHKGLTC